MGLRYVTASLERLILYLYPTMVVVLSALFLGKPITRRAVGALVLSYAGIALVFRHDAAVAGDAGETFVGGALVFGSALAYAVYLVAAGGVIARIGSMRFTALAMLASTVFVVRPPLETPTGRFISVVHLQRMLRHPPHESIGQIVDTDIEPLRPDTPLSTVARELATYNLLMLPVVDEDRRLLGAVSVDDVLDHLLPEDWREADDDPAAEAHHG